MMLNRPPKISIIIGVLNMAHYLADALDSVIKQNYPALELIIIDGGSTDGTLDIIKQYDKHVTIWQSGQDKGHADACNKALKIATGDFICLLNADDLLGADLLHKVAAIYQKNPNANLITCGVQIVEKDANQHNHVIKEIIHPNLLQISLENILFGLPVINARFFHKSIFEKFGEFQATHPDGGYNLSNDRDFLTRLALAHIQSEIIPEPLYYYLSHNDSLTFSQKNIIKSHKEHILLAERFLKTADLSMNQQKLFNKWKARESVYLCLLYLLKLRLKDSLSMLIYGFPPHTITWLGQLGNIVTARILKTFKKTSL